MCCGIPIPRLWSVLAAWGMARHGQPLRSSLQGFARIPRDRVLLLACACQQIQCDANPENAKYLYSICTTPAQRLRRWPAILQMLYKCFFYFTGKSNSGNCPVFCSATASSVHSSGQDEDRNQVWLHILLMNASTACLAFRIKMAVLSEPD